MRMFVCCFSLYSLSYSIVANLAIVYSSFMPVLICVLYLVYVFLCTFVHFLDP